MAKASRDKGKRGESEVVNLFEAAGLSAYRSAALQAGEVEGAADVTVRDFPELHVESKRCERYELPAWQRQADKAAGEDVPVIFYRRNGSSRKPEPWRAVVPGEWLAALLSEVAELRAWKALDDVLDANSAHVCPVDSAGKTCADYGLDCPSRAR